MTMPAWQVTLTLVIFGSVLVCQIVLIRQWKNNSAIPLAAPKSLTGEPESDALLRSVGIESEMLERFERLAKTPTAGGPVIFAPGLMVRGVGRDAIERSDSEQEVIRSAIDQWFIQGGNTNELIAQILHVVRLQPPSTIQAAAERESATPFDINALLGLMLAIRDAETEWNQVGDESAISAGVWATEIERILKPFEVVLPASSPQPPETDR